VSGHCDSIRERRAQESWENGGRAKTTTQTAKPLSIGLLVAQKIPDPDVAADAIIKLVEGRLDVDYFSWNGRC
jgi:hypothetical protein